MLQRPGEHATKTIAYKAFKELSVAGTARAGHVLPALQSILPTTVHGYATRNFIGGCPASCPWFKLAGQTFVAKW